MKRAFDERKLTAMLSQVEQLSDGEAVIATVSMIEYYLGQTLRLEMRDMESAEDKRIFGYDGPLGSLDAKTKMCYALKIISKETRDELDRVREIRNEFTHFMYPLDFSDPYMAEKALSLGTILNVIGYTRAMQEDEQFASDYKKRNARPSIERHADGSVTTAIRFPDLNTPRGRFLGTVKAFFVSIYMQRSLQKKPDK